MASINLKDLVKVEVDAAESFRLGIKLKASSDGLKLYAVFRKNPPSVEIMEKFIRSSGVKSELNLDQFQDLGTIIDIMDRKEPVCISDMSDKYPHMPDWTFQVHKDAIGLYFQQSAQPNSTPVLGALHVQEGEHVATKEPSENIQAHLSYKDIFSQPRDGKFRIFSLKVGKGLEKKDDGKIVATATGFLVIAGDTISVRDRMMLEKPSEVGDKPITFLGTIEVSKKVVKAPSLMAGRNIIINGDWQAGSLKADDTITIRGELSGEDLIDVEAKGGIEADFINQGRLRCEGDIKISNGAFYSAVRAMGKLTVPDGVVSGGRFYGAKGVTVFEAGDEDGEETVLAAGQSERNTNSAGAYVAERDTVKAKLKQVQETVAPYLQDAQQQDALDDEARQTLKQLMGAMKTLKARFVELTNLIEKAGESDEPDYGDVTITVKGKIYPGVKIVINMATFDVIEMMDGATFSYDADERKVKVEGK